MVRRKRRAGVRRGRAPQTLIVSKESDSARRKPGVHSVHVRWHRHAHSPETLKARDLTGGRCREDTIDDSAMMRQQMGALGGGAPGTDMQKAFEGERAALELVRSRYLPALDLAHAFRLRLWALELVHCH